jgi:purine-binding chemotaxis protein CheW
MQVVGLRCGNGTYAIASELVREIAPLGRLTRLPGAPAHVLGIQNLRGQLVTVVDLGARLTGAPSRAAERTVLVLQVGQRHLGVVGDEVTEVFDLVDYAANKRTDGASESLVAGVGHFGEVVVFVIDAPELVRQSLA